MKSDILFLKENRIFNGLFNGDGNVLEEVVVSKAFQRKELIFKPGDDADAIYWIRSGRIKIYKVTEDGREIIFGMYQPGEMFGEMAFWGDEPRDCYAEAMEETRCLAIQRANLFRLAKRKPKIIYRIGKLVNERRRQTEEELESLLYKCVRGRLAGQLLKLSERFGIEDNRGRLLRIKITHKDMASLIGSSRETVSLMLSEMRRQGLIDLNSDRKIIIRDADQLAQIT